MSSQDPDESPQSRMKALGLAVSLLCAACITTGAAMPATPGASIAERAEVPGTPDFPEYKYFRESYEPTYLSPTY